MVDKDWMTDGQVTIRNLNNDHIQTLEHGSRMNDDYVSSAQWRTNQPRPFEILHLLSEYARRVQRNCDRHSLPFASESLDNWNLENGNRFRILWLQGSLLSACPVDMAAYKIWMFLSNGKRAILENVLNATPYFLAFFTNDQLGRSRTRMEHVIVVVDCGQLVPTALSTLDGYSHQRGSI